MERDHYIKWIAQETNNELVIKRLKPGENPLVEFDHKPNSKVYSYCNKHKLWINNEENEKN